MVEVTRIPFGTIILYFILYLGIHIGIGYYNEIIQKEYQQNLSDEEMRKKAVITKMLFRWFPAVYVIFVIIVLYNS